MAEKILIIEDDEIVAKVLKRAIEKEGFETFVASDGVKGLEIFNREKPPIVLTDLKMPNMDGFEILHNIKKIDPITEVIIVTGFGDIDTAIMAIREGAIDYLKKPIDLEELITAIGRASERLSEKKKLILKPVVLLFEDEDMTREKLTRVLKNEGWDVFAAADGEEGLKMFYEIKIDVIIADLKMPKKDGIQVLREVKKSKLDCEVIMLTGYGDETSAIQALREGAINYLKKPIDLDQIIIAVQKALDTLSMSRALKYKTRELELMTQFVTKITQKKEIIVDVRDGTRREARDFAHKIMDIIPLPVFVVDENLNIPFSNKILQSIVENVPAKLDEKFLCKLANIGIVDISIDSVKKSVNKLMAGQVEIEQVPFGSHAYLILAGVRVVGDAETKDMVLIIVRGERSQ